MIVNPDKFQVLLIDKGNQDHTNEVVQRKIVTEKARTKLTIFFKYVLRKQKQKVKPTFYRDVLVFFTIKDIKMVCVLTPY